MDTYLKGKLGIIQRSKKKYFINKTGENLRK